MIYRLVMPHEFLVDWELAVYEPFKSGQAPVMWYIEQPNPEERKIYHSVTEWLDAQRIPRNAKVLPESFAPATRRGYASRTKSQLALKTCSLF